MAINYNNGSAVRHLKYNGNYVKELKYNGTVAWEDVCAVWSPGTMPDGVASISAQRYGKKEPSAKTYTALASGESIYNGDTLYISLTPASYWTLSSSSFTAIMTSGNLGDLGTEYTITAGRAMTMGNITASRSMRTVTFSTPTCSTSYVYPREKFKYVATYMTLGGSFATWTGVPKESVSAWNGYEVNWQLSLADSLSYGWSMSSKTGSVAVGTGNATVTPSVSLSIRENYRWMPIINPACGGSFGGFPITRTSTTTSGSGLAGFSVWNYGGASSYSSNGILRVSGTATVTNASGYSTAITFSNKQPTSSSVTLGSYSMSGSSGSVVMRGNDLLTTNVTNTGATQLTKVVLKLTAIEVYVRYDAYSMIEMAAYAPPTVGVEGGYGEIYMETNFLSGISAITQPYVRMCGYMEDSTGSASTDDAFRSLGQVTSYSDAFLDPFTALNDSSAEGEVTGMDFYLAFWNSADTVPISNMYTCDNFIM